MVKAKILVVDDQPMNIQILASLLQNQYDVRVATGGQKALAIVEEETVDLILLDVMMPEMDGFEVCRQLKNNPKTQYIPIIFVTAKDNAQDEEKGLNLGAVDYISKPFTTAIVKARIRNHIALKQHADLLEELASIDPLTHLANRRQLDKVLSEEWKRAQRGNLPISLLLADIDFFKHYNDNYGHGMGDLCLQAIARSMSYSQNRAGDFVARFGGEEFVVVLPNTDNEGAKGAGERLLEAVKLRKIEHLYSKVADFVTLSVGCATLYPSGNDNDFNKLITIADKNLYSAKNSGRNCVV